MTEKTVSAARSAAMDYLLKSKVDNAGLLYVLRRGTAEVVRADAGGVLLYDTYARLYLLSGGKEDFVPLMHGCDIACVVGGSLVDSVRAAYGLKEAMECDQYAYFGAPYGYEPRLSLASPTEAELELIIKDYDNLTPEEVREHAADGSLFTAHDASGAMVGFIGRHGEGSIGMLEVLSQYRRLGYAVELEKYMVNRTISEGNIPFGHVKSWNSASLELQKKMGFEHASQKVYWIF